MTKFYKNINSYADDLNICRQVASKRIKDGTANLINIPKGMKYLKLDISYFLDDINIKDKES